MKNFGRAILIFINAIFILGEIAHSAFYLYCRKQNQIAYIQYGRPVLPILVMKAQPNWPPDSKLAFGVLQHLVRDYIGDHNVDVAPRKLPKIDAAEFARVLRHRLFRQSPYRQICCYPSLRFGVKRDNNKVLLYRTLLEMDAAEREEFLKLVREIDPEIKSALDLLLENRDFENLDPESVAAWGVNPHPIGVERHQIYLRERGLRFEEAVEASPAPKFTEGMPIATAVKARDFTLLNEFLEDARNKEKMPRMRAFRRLFDWQADHYSENFRQFETSSNHLQRALLVLSYLGPNQNGQVLSFDGRRLALVGAAENSNPKEFLKFNPESASGLRVEITETMLFGLHREIGYIPSSYLRAYIEYIGAENFKADYGNLNSQFRAHILDGILINKDWEAAKALSEAGINFKKELEAVRENTIHVSRMKENAFATYFSLPPAKQRDFLDSHPDLRTRHPNAVEFNLGLWAGRQDDYLDFPEKVGSFEPRTRAESLALIEENYPGLIATLAGDVD